MPPATKLLGGHFDLLTGVATTSDPAMHEALRKARELSGGTPGTLEAYLAVRGRVDEAIRPERAQASAMIAKRLEEHPRHDHALPRPRVPSPGMDSGGKRKFVDFDVYGRYLLGV